MGASSISPKIVAKARWDPRPLNPRQLHSLSLAELSQFFHLIPSLMHSIILVKCNKPLGATGDLEGCPELESACIPSFQRLGCLLCLPQRETSPTLASSTALCCCAGRQLRGLRWCWRWWHFPWGKDPGKEVFSSLIVYVGELTAIPVGWRLRFRGKVKTGLYIWWDPEQVTETRSAPPWF